MIRLPSLSKPYHAFVTFDEAIVQPPAAPEPLDMESDPPPSDEMLAAHKEALETHGKALEEHFAKMRAARQTGDWGPVTVPGKHPLRFLMRQMPFDGWAVVNGMMQRQENEEDILLLAVQLCLMEIDGAPIVVERERHPRLGDVASLSCLSRLGNRNGLRAAVELGALAINKAGADDF
ncbi:MAG TPA: hypothetical protein VFB62_24700 [Polyangiaceae bacterium]|nr:hypothetical protein [Polyangiaceae bacterium]